MSNIDNELVQPLTSSATDVPEVVSLAQLRQNLIRLAAKGFPATASLDGDDQGRLSWGGRVTFDPETSAFKRQPERSVGFVLRETEPRGLK